MVGQVPLSHWTKEHVNVRALRLRATGLEGTLSSTKINPGPLATYQNARYDKHGLPPERSLDLALVVGFQ